MTIIKRNGNQTSYGIKHYVVDTKNDLNSLPLNSIFSGSTAFVIESSSTYMLNGQKKWIQINNVNNSGGGESGEDGNHWDGGLIV